MRLCSDQTAVPAKTFNTNVSGIQFFMKFLEVKGYIKKVPFYASYYLEKQIPVHHDRSVEEDVYMEIIQNLSQFPEHLRMMFLHLWCVGLRISEPSLSVHPQRYSKAVLKYFSGKRLLFYFCC